MKRKTSITAERKQIHKHHNRSMFYSSCYVNLHSSCDESNSLDRILALSGLYLEHCPMFLLVYLLCV